MPGDPAHAGCKYDGDTDGPEIPSNTAEKGAHPSDALTLIPRDDGVLHAGTNGQSSSSLQDLDRRGCRKQWEGPDGAERDRALLLETAARNPWQAPYGKVGLAWEDVAAALNNQHRLFGDPALRVVGRTIRDRITHMLKSFSNQEEGTKKRTPCETSDYKERSTLLRQLYEMKKTAEEATGKFTPKHGNDKKRKGPCSEDADDDTEEENPAKGRRGSTDVLSALQQLIGVLSERADIATKTMLELQQRQLKIDEERLELERRTREEQLEVSRKQAAVYDKQLEVQVKMLAVLESLSSNGKINQS
mmetsp:Transcript_7757/g.15858  ORF Transcript_7757/g.15858 Transcript_7757/m.15858 type:complete len:304 (-) Transcript_7757:31-942(-)